jgi:hypothetical protein
MIGSPLQVGPSSVWMGRLFLWASEFFVLRNGGPFPDWKAAFLRAMTPE